MDNKDGVWRTIRGRRVFIAKGESLGQAMAKSGKFKENGNLPKRSTLKEARLGQQTKDIDKKLSKEKKLNKYKELLNKDRKNVIKNDSHDELPFTKRLVENIGKNQAEKNRINENAPINEKGKTRVQRNKERYSETDRQELRHDIVQKKLADYKAKKQSNNKIKKMVKRGNTYIPIRENEDEKKTVRDYERTNTESYRRAVEKMQDDDRMLQDGVHLTLNDEKARKQIKEARERKGRAIDYTMSRREALMKFAMKERPLIDKWIREYDDETDKRVGKKILNNEGLTVKEYFGYLGRKPREGDIILSGGKNGEDVRVGKDGKLEEIKNYRRRKGK